MVITVYIRQMFLYFQEERERFFLIWKTRSLMLSFEALSLYHNSVMSNFFYCVYCTDKEDNVNRLVEAMLCFQACCVRKLISQLLKYLCTNNIQLNNNWNNFKVCVGIRHFEA